MAVSLDATQAIKLCSCLYSEATSFSPLRGIPPRADRSLCITRTREGEANMPMPDLANFYSVLRSGDRLAVESLLRDLDPFLRKCIRLRLIDERLRRTMDTNDILQSLLNDFLSQDVKASPAVASANGLYAYLAVAVQ